jgi:hypothetical protein
MKITRQDSDNVNESIEAIVDIVEKDILQVQTKNPQEENYMEIIFYLILNLINIVEEYFIKSEGLQKKLLVIEIGEVLTKKYFSQYLDYYNQNIDNIIETVITSFKILRKHKSISQGCSCLSLFFRS